ncbi:hypothetical protein CC80DRAFT_397713 [Byssothecium circinans]|uniref:Heterokaryon incompatibility domain-containing protein n=1 Tax=Byssothecium circinans TaxID=147558 RepID=A0A6A5UFW2_9PLEO|nr:hypothetical protein CC80DRAFT_397713 [Byssothecium circinans]
MFYGQPLSDPDCWRQFTLMKRGWIFQERLLSPCSIYFGDRIRWECSQLQACEVFPKGSPSVSCFAPWGLDGTPLRVNGLLFDKNPIWKGTMGRFQPTDERELNRKWLFLVQEFAACQLTFPSDCFQAISGLARHFQKVHGDQYVAGLWRRDLCSGLLWNQDCDMEDPQYLSEYRGEYQSISMCTTIY